MVYISPILNILSRIVRDSGKKLIRDFNEIEKLQSSIKGTSKFVELALDRHKRLLLETLKEIKLDYEIFFEKNEAFEKNSALLVIPIDGKTNFSHGLPHFCTTLCVIENRTLKTCLSYDPIKDEMFYSSEGKGAYLNDSRIRVSSRKNTEKLILSTNLKKFKQFNSIEIDFIKSSSYLRQSGCASLDVCYLACGRSEILIFDNTQNLNLLSMKLIIKESGGLIFDCSDKYDGFIATNNHCKNFVEEIVNKI
ncbi:MAG: hypothetical protein CMP25_03235 [Rickettsiales bacterium]|nr:hypothetical protein [Rickettsiales bacterium]|tara:strand:+ start:547 stop:1299 length:753 start_codon:yes stop_codon:yes gene_type:complete